MTDAPLVRLVDDDPDLLEAQAQGLHLAGFRAETFTDAASALDGLGRDWPGWCCQMCACPAWTGFSCSSASMR
ncbi:hypothetical protein ACFSS8_23295 [Paracoccus kondratievae]